MGCDDDEDDKSKSRRNGTKKVSVSMLRHSSPLFLLSLCIYPGDAFIKDV